MANQKDAVAKNDEGVRLLQAGDDEGAIAAFSEALAVDPNLTVAYRNRAAVYRRLGRLKEAKVDSEINASFLDQTAGETHWRLSQSFWAGFAAVVYQWVPWVIAVPLIRNYLKKARRHCRRNHRSAHASCTRPR